MAHGPLVYRIWVPGVMTYLTAAENRKSLFTVTQIELGNCIFEHEKYSVLSLFLPF